MPGDQSATSEQSAAKPSQPPVYGCVSKIGKGAYSTVWLGVDKSNGEEVAIKVVSDPKYFTATVYEFNITSGLDHPNICRNRACFKTQSQSVMLVQDYAMHGDLFNKVVPEIGMPPDMIHRYFTHMLDGVAYLHQKNIVHRDIKPENVLIDRSDIAKLCDFGMADYDGKVVAHGSGTGPYMAPEILQNKKAGFVALRTHDIWALGVTLYILLTGDFPWLKALPNDEEFSDYLDGTLRGSWNLLHPDMVALLRRMLCPDCAQRAQIDEVREAFASIAMFKPSGHAYSDSLCSTATEDLCDLTEPVLC